MNEIKNLEPQIVWKNFHALTRVPRPSGHLEKVQQFLLDWAAAHGIEAFKDKGENIVMRKPATPGMENRKKAVMQAHMDMVPQKTAESRHNFETDPIETYIDGEFIRAGETLEDITEQIDQDTLDAIKGLVLGAERGGTVLAALHGSRRAVWRSTGETVRGYGISIWTRTPP